MDAVTPPGARKFGHGAIILTGHKPVNSGAVLISSLRFRVLNWHALLAVGASSAYSMISPDGWSLMGKYKDNIFSGSACISLPFARETVNDAPYASIHRSSQYKVLRALSVLSGLGLECAQTRVPFLQWAFPSLSTRHP